MHCSKCDTEKPDSEFPKKNCKWCKDCKNKYEKERRSKNREHQNALNKASYQKNKKTEKVLFNPNEQRKCTQCGKKKSLGDFHVHTQKGVLRSECKDCASKNRKQYYQDHKEAVVKQTNEYKKEKMKKDPGFKLERKLRCRIYKAFSSKSLKKSDRTWKYLGCTKDFFQEWIAYQLSDEMTIENYGSVWHIDHVKPCASYDLNINEQAYECFNWKNCRPLLVSENLEKKDKVDEVIIEEHQKTVHKFQKFWSNKNKQ
jgi:Prasinovirus endonuclease VII